MELIASSGATTPSETCGSHHTPSKLKNTAINLPPLRRIAEQEHRGSEATLPEGVKGEMTPVQPLVDCQGFLPTVVLNVQPLPFFQHINSLARINMQPANLNDILPIVPERSRMPAPPRHRMVGEWPALLSSEQLCDYLDISLSTLPKVCPVQPVDLGVNVLRWRRAEIDRWLASLLPRSLSSRSRHGDKSSVPALLEVTPGPEERRAAVLERARKAAGARR